MRIKTSYKVKFGGGSYSPELVAENPIIYAEKLYAQRATVGHALCLCNENNLKLQIRRHGSVFHLAVWVNEGHLHKTGCFFNRKSHAEDIANRSHNSSIKINTNGRIVINPKFPINIGIECNGSSLAHGYKKSHDSKKKYMGLQGLLNLIWEESRNNQYFGIDRNHSKAFYHVIHSGGMIRLGKSGLNKLLYVPCSFHKHAVDDLMHYLRKESHGKTPTAFICAEVLAVRKVKYSYEIRLSHTNQKIYADQALWDKLYSSYRRQIQNCETSTNGERLVTLMQVCLSGNNPQTATNLKLLDSAFLMTSEQYVPVDSTHECELANVLTSNRRRFIKPLSIEDELKPDFILLDTKPNVFIEVWGMETPEYLERKRVKVTLYRKSDMRLIEWDAINNDIPNLPKVEI